MVFRLPKNMLNAGPRPLQPDARKFDGTKDPSIGGGFVRLLSQHAQELGAAHRRILSSLEANLWRRLCSFWAEAPTLQSRPLERVIGALEKRVMHPGFELSFSRSNSTCRSVPFSVCSTRTEPHRANGCLIGVLKRRGQLRSPAFAGRSVTEIALSAGSRSGAFQSWLPRTLPYEPGQVAHRPRSPDL